MSVRRCEDPRFALVEIGPDDDEIIRAIFTVSATDCLLAARQRMGCIQRFSCGVVVKLLITRPPVCQSLGNGTVLVREGNVDGPLRAVPGAGQAGELEPRRHS